MLALVSLLVTVILGGILILVSAEVKLELVPVKVALPSLSVLQLNLLASV